MPGSILGSDHAPVALRADWQAQLRRCGDELGFRHVRFHGLLSDDAMSLLDHLPRSHLADKVRAVQKGREAVAFRPHYHSAQMDGRQESLWVLDRHHGLLFFRFPLWLLLFPLMEEMPAVFLFPLSLVTTPTFDGAVFAFMF